MSFWAAFGTPDGTVLRLKAGDMLVLDNPLDGLAGKWARYTADLSGFDSGTSVSFEFEAVLQGTEDYVALDDVSVTCEDDADSPSWAGSCACDVGYAYGNNIPDQLANIAPGCNIGIVDVTRSTAQCMPTLATVLKENAARFSTFWSIIGQQGTTYLSELSQTVGPRHTLLVPSNDAFGAEKGWSTEMLTKLIPSGIQDLDGANYDTMVKDFFQMHMMQKEYLPACLGNADGSLTEMISENGFVYTLTSDVGSPQYVFNGKMKLLEHIPAGNGQIIVVDTATMLSDWKTTSTDSLDLDKFCKHCDANAICDAPRPLTNCPGGCFARSTDEMRKCFNGFGGNCKTVCNFKKKTYVFRHISAYIYPRFVHDAWSQNGKSSGVCVILTR